MMSRAGSRGVSGCARWPALEVSDVLTVTCEYTYKRETAVATRGNLGLIRVDEDLGMACRAATAIAGHDPVVCPADRLLVNELHGGVWLRLCQASSISLDSSTPHVPLSFLVIRLRNSMKVASYTAVYGCHRCPYLQVRSGLLKTRTRHGFGARALATRPDAGPVGGLLHWDRDLAVDHLDCVVLLLGHGSILELTGGRGKGARAGTQLARHPLGSA